MPIPRLRAVTTTNYRPAAQPTSRQSSGRGRRPCRLPSPAQPPTPTAPNDPAAHANVSQNEPDPIPPSGRREAKVLRGLSRAPRNQPRSKTAQRPRQEPDDDPRRPNAQARTGNKPTPTPGGHLVWPCRCRLPAGARGALMSSTISLVTRGLRGHAGLSSVGDLASVLAGRLERQVLQERRPSGGRRSLWPVTRHAPQRAHRPPQPTPSWPT